MKQRFLVDIPNSRKIMLGFLLIVLLGAALLLLPCATREGQSTTVLGALFTSVSATCVTGLVVYDTYTHWTLFGQLVLLLQIQIGGLGFITVLIFGVSMSRKKIGINLRMLLQDSLSTPQLRGGVRLVRRIIRATVFFESIGAALLALRFIPQMGLAKGIYFGIFHAVSAFCNAGFDLMGMKDPFCSFVYEYDDPVIILTLSALIVIGGIGFVVWNDIWEHGLDHRQYGFHTKVVLSSTALLIGGGTVLFLLMEARGQFAGMSLRGKLLSALFSAVTPRTAGFNSVNTAKLSNGSFFLTVFLMFIGGSPGSTAGGIKTVTFVVILMQLSSYAARKRDCVLFDRRLSDETIKKAAVVMITNLLFVSIGMMVIYCTQESLPFQDILFETFSAIGTVGMSTGVTRALGPIPMIVIIILMFLGRMGGLTFAMAFAERKTSSSIRHIEGNVLIG